MSFIVDAQHTISMGVDAFVAGDLRYGGIELWTPGVTGQKRAWIYVDDNDIQWGVQGTGGGSDSEAVGNWTTVSMSFQITVEKLDGSYTVKLYYGGTEKGSYTLTNWVPYGTTATTVPREVIFRRGSPFYACGGSQLPAPAGTDRLSYSSSVEYSNGQTKAWSGTIDSYVETYCGTYCDYKGRPWGPWQYAWYILPDVAIEYEAPGYLTVQDNIPPLVSIEFSPEPEEGPASPDETEFNIHHAVIAAGTNVQVIAPAINPSGYRWLYWDFPGDDNRTNKTQTFILDADKTIIATYKVGAAGLDILQAEPGVPVWIYTAGATDLYERRETDGEDTSILAETVDNPSAWLQPGGRRYVAFDLDGDCQYIYYDGTWSTPVVIRADRTDPAAIALPQSRDVMIVCKDASDNLKLNLLRWNGASYDVETEIAVGVTGNQTGDGWVGAGGNVYLAFTDTNDDLQTTSSDLSGATWA